MMLDEHGYVENTLIEPTTPPHGQNYDFDLYIKHGYANGLAMEKGVQGLGHPETAKPEIPFRDYPVGEWDGWAPIYTAQYAMYHGAVSYTIEIPHAGQPGRLRPAAGRRSCSGGRDQHRRRRGHHQDHDRLRGRQPRAS